MPQKSKRCRVDRANKARHEQSSGQNSEVKGDELVVAEQNGVPMHRASLDVVRSLLYIFASQLLTVNRIKRCQLLGLMSRKPIQKPSA